MVKLVYNDQSGWEHSVELGAQNPMVMIGRNADCGIQTTNASVSRVHAMVTWQDGKLFVQDPPKSRPTNGTKVDGMRLQPGEILEMFVGSELLCGNFAIHVVSDGGGGDNVQHMGEQGMMSPGAQPGQYAQPYTQQRGGYSPQNMAPQAMPRRDFDNRNMRPNAQPIQMQPQQPQQPQPIQ